VFLGDVADRERRIGERTDDPPACEAQRGPFYGGAILYDLTQVRREVCWLEPLLPPPDDALVDLTP
jgi:hypothetical protein